MSTVTIASGSASTSKALWRIAGREERDERTEDADQANVVANSTRDQFSEPFAVWSPSRLRESVRRVLGEANREDWDGYGSAPANEASVEAAQDFIELLPPGVPLPEVAVDPDGELAFDWQAGADRMLSVSIAPDGSVSYAGLAKGQRFYGTDRIMEEFPEEVNKRLQELFADAGSDTWAA